eukprot:SAG11_NODE_35054_length_268_cov_1.491124_1_plen_40_part_10
MDPTAAAPAADTAAPVAVVPEQPPPSTVDLRAIPLELWDP